MLDYLEETTDDLATACERVLNDTDRFACAVTDFRARPQQAAMVRYVADAISDKNTLLIEAGTGVGKTFAYLLPAILSGKRMVISTHTRYLQEQIFYKDLPGLLKVLDLQEDVDVVLLKGRANYLCLERADHRWHTPDLGDKQQSLMAKVRAWSKQTQSGDISEFKTLGEDNPLWGNLTSTTESCLGTKCKFYEDCFVTQARKAALEADIVIVNHYLLLADMTLKEDGFGQLLPAVDTVIVDEAHQLKDVADNFLGDGFSSRQIRNLLDDLSSEAELLNDTPAVGKILESISEGIDILLKLLQKFPPRENTAVLLADEIFVAAAEEFQADMAKLEELLEAQSERGDEIRQYCERARDLGARLHKALHPDAEQVISWYQTQKYNFRFYDSPVEIAPLLSEGCSHYNANWIYTSATLSVNGTFDYLKRSLGIDEESESVILDSPFDYEKQAVMYLPDKLVEPNHPEHTERLLELSSPLLVRLEGKAFFLFTSHRALQIAKEYFADDENFCLLVQGAAPKRELIRRFYEEDNALLLGTSGFWEGVDVRGAGLRCVIVDRLPFASPQDPLVQGRTRLARERDGDFFIETSLPEAVVSLRQGVGRLIRDEYDNGIIMIGDRRLWTKGYGKVFMNSLPEMPAYHHLEDLYPYLRKAV